MLVQRMKMRGNVKLELNGSMTFSSRLYDKTPFYLTVGEHDVQLNEGFKPSKMTVEGWLYVDKESQQADRCYLTLPKPTIQFGRQVTVSEFDLMPVGVTLEHFKAKPGRKVALDPNAKKEEIESKVLNTPKKLPGTKVKAKKSIAAKK